MASKRARNNGHANRDPVPDGRRNAADLDRLNIKIMKELILNPGASSTEIAEKYGVPLSTIQRRRARLEQDFIRKQYNLDVRQLGWRQADVLISVEKGKAEGTARHLLEDPANNITGATLRIGHPQIDILAQIFYKDSQELHRITEQIKSVQYVTSVEWSEVVKDVGTNLAGMVDRVLFLP